MNHVDQGDDPCHLAAIVPMKAADESIESLRREGVYDDTRRIRSTPSESLEIPIIQPPQETLVTEVIHQPDPEYKKSTLDDLLRDRGWSATERGRAPKSWAVVGTVILVRFDDCPDEAAVGEALLELHGGAETVLAREGITGIHREPAVRIVAGSGETETIHTEYGTHYALDLARVMFSPGNKAERVRMGKLVATGERVIDMFAGIGYFSLPMARAGAHVMAIERNPTAFRYLLENAVLNGVEDLIDAFRADCRDVVGREIVAHESPGTTPDQERPIGSRADRIVMGFYDASDRAYLDSALSAIEPGGVLHLHAAVLEAELWERPTDALDRAATDAGLSVEVLERRRVKSHSAGVEHVVIDAQIHTELREYRRH